MMAVTTITMGPSNVKGTRVELALRQPIVQRNGATLTTAPLQLSAIRASTHHAGDATRPSLWPGDAVFEVAEGSRPDIARPHVSPGPAGFLAFTGALAALAGWVRRQLEIPIVAAAAINGKLDRSGIHLDDAGTAHTRHAAGRGHAWRNPRLEPAQSIGVLGQGIGKRPGAAARITLAARSAQRGIARA